MSPNQFYTTKTHKLRRGWRMLENLLLIKWGELLFYDGNTVMTVAAELSFPNGINVSPSRRYHNNPKFLDRYAWAHSADPDQTPPRGAVW